MDKRRGPSYYSTARPLPLSLSGENKHPKLLELIVCVCVCVCGTDNNKIGEIDNLENTMGTF